MGLEVFRFLGFRNREIIVLATHQVVRGGYWALWLAALVAFGIIGLIKGFLNTLLSLFGNLASVGVAVLCAKPVAKFLDNVFGLVSKLGDKIAGTINGVTPFMSDPSRTSLTGEQLRNVMPNNSLYDRALRLFVEDGRTFQLVEDTAEARQALDQDIVNYIGGRVGAVLAIVIAAVVMFILLRIALLLLSRLFNALSKNKAVSGLDKTLGLVFGLLKGAIIISLVLGIFYLVANETVNGWIEGSTVTKWVYNYICQFIEWAVTKFSLPKVITDLFPQTIPNP